MVSLLIAAFVGSGALTYAATASLSFATTIEGGSLVESASYVVFKDGSTYFAKNGTTGAIDYSGTNASEIINNVWQPNTRILLKAGIYVLTTKLSAQNNSVLEGENAYTTILYAANSAMGHIICHAAKYPGQPAPFGDPNYNVTIKNLGFRVNSGDPADRGIFIKTNDLTVENCVFKGFDGYYVKAVYSENVKILNCKGYDSGADGFHFLYVNNGWMESNYAENTDGDSYAVVHTNNTVVSNNIAVGDGSGQEWGVDVWGLSYNVTVDNNLIANMAMSGLGIKAYESKDPYGVTLSNNKIETCGEYGIYVISTYTGNESLINLRITNNDLVDIQYAGIRVLAASYGIMTGNHIIDVGLGTNNTWYGIVIDHSSGNYSNSWVVNNNIIRNTQAPTLTVKYCIYLMGSYHVCIGNIAYDAGTTNIQDSSTGSVVDHNQENGL